MKTFNDSAGRTWTVAINTNAIKRAKETSGVSLVDIVGGDLYGRMVLDPVLVCDIAYGVCKSEADGRKFSREDFNAALVGDSIAAARDAILEDLVDFFPNPVRAKLKIALAGPGTGTGGEATKSGDSSGNSPAPSASIPAT